MTNISANKNSETAISVTGQAVAEAEPVAEMVEEQHEAPENHDSLAYTGSSSLHTLPLQISRVPGRPLSVRRLPSASFSTTSVPTVETRPNCPSPRCSESALTVQDASRCCQQDCHLKPSPVTQRTLTGAAQAEAWISSRLTGRRGSVSKKEVLSFLPQKPEPAFLVVTIL